MFISKRISFKSQCWKTTYHGHINKFITLGQNWRGKNNKPHLPIKINISTCISLCCLLLLINLISPYLLNKSHYLRGLISCELFDFFTLKRIIPQQVRPSVFYWFVILVKGKTLTKLCSNSHYWLWKSLFDLIYYYPIIIIWEYWFQAMRDQVQFASLSLKHWVTIIWFINILI